MKRGPTTSELRNLPHITSTALNEPLLLELAYMRVFFCTFAGQLGITRLTDTVSGVTLGAEQMAEPLTLFSDDKEMGPKPARNYQITDGIVVLPVSGTLISKTRSPQPYSGMTGYNGTITHLQQAISDSGADGTLLDMDTSNGMVAGAFNCTDIIVRMWGIKPIRALANDMNCNVDQLIVNAASRRPVTQTARTGFIGVMMAHSNYGAALKTSSAEATSIHSGDHKVDGNPYEKLPKEVRADFQARIDATRQMFAEKVAGYTGMSIQAILDTEAAAFSGQESVNSGPAEQLINNMDALSVMRDVINKRAVISRGESAKGTTASTGTTQPAASADQTVTTIDVSTAVVTDPAAGVAIDTSNQMAAVVAAEDGRVMGILNCEETKGRESQVRALTEIPRMTVESAQRILTAVPLSAQACTGTALDCLVEAAPGTVTAGNAPTGAGDDLLNTPVQEINMSNTEQFTHNQSLRNSDLAHISFTPGKLTKVVSAIMPLMLDATSGKLAVWDGQRSGVVCGVLAVSADQSSTELAFYKSDSFRIKDAPWPDAVTDEHIKRNAFVGIAISIV